MKWPGQKHAPQSSRCLFETLRQAERLSKGVVTATRGNHGQSIVVAAIRDGVQCLVIVPQGNSEEKNAAMRGFGAEVLEAGADFDESRAIAVSVAEERGYQTVPAFHPTIVKGVATCAYELLKAVPELAVVYVPIGMGSGLIRESARYRGQRVATVFSGANIDVTMLTEGLSGRTPQI